METPKFFHVLEGQTLPAEGASNGRRYKFGPFELDTEKHVLSRQQLPLALPPKCFDLLCILVSNSQALLEKDQLMRALWPDTFVEEANLSNLVAMLRKALGDSPAKSQYIQTVPKLGYRFAAPIHITDGPQAPSAAQPRPAVRIIVFPFASSTAFDDRDRLTYSLPDAISSSLAELNAFAVRSIHVAMRFDPLHWDPKQVAKEADVDFILTGTLGSQAFGIHAVIQLIHAPSGTLLWTKSWDVNTSELLKLHQGVVQLVVRSLVRGTADTGISPSQTGTPSHSAAYNLYLMANQLSLNRTPENMALARDLYVACVERDPSFAQAWARLGRCYRFLEKFGTEHLPDHQLAQKALERAFALNPDLILAHSLYTPIQADVGQAESAMVRLLNTLTFHQNSPELFAALVHACRYCGQLDASLAAHRKAVELDPSAHTSVAHTYFALGDFERTLFWYGTGAGLYLDALALACMDRNDEAAALLWTRKEKFDLMHAPMRSLEAYLQSDPERGIAILRAAQSSPSSEPELRFYMARQAAKFGDLSLANQLLLRSVEEGYWSAVGLQRDPWLEPLRATADYAQILEMVKTREAKSRAAFLNAGGESILSLQVSGRKLDGWPT
jgi:DNA-binding winged helix-turn-helix (wHTH) protein/tetratricopeptide (TPR) repeat protein